MVYRGTFVHARWSANVSARGGRSDTACVTDQKDFQSLTAAAAVGESAAAT